MGIDSESLSILSMTSFGMSGKVSLPDLFDSIDFCFVRLVEGCLEKVEEVCASYLSCLAICFISAKSFSEAFLMASKSSGFEKLFFFIMVNLVMVLPIFDSTRMVLSIFFFARTFRIERVLVPSALDFSISLAMSSRISIISSTLAFSSYIASFFSIFKYFIKC